MKNALAEKLVEIIGSIQNGIAATTDFAVAQLPDVAQQYIAFGRVNETAGLAAMLLLVALGIWLIFRSLKATKEDGDYFPSVIASACATGAAIYFTVIVFEGAVMVWFAPKIYLIKGLANLIK